MTKVGRPAGIPKTGGRQKGTPNKVTQEMRAALLAAFDEVGGYQYLVCQAKENPQAFMSLLGKLVPREVGLTGDIPRLIMRDFSGDSRSGHRQGYGQSED